MPEIFYFISDFIYGTDWRSVIFWARIVSGFASVLLFVGIVILVIKINLVGQAAILVSEAVNVSAVPKRKLVKKWDEIRKKFEKGDDANMRLAVIEADKLIDGLLERMGYHGTSMGERLEKITAGQFPRIDDMWKAHKIRNQIVHDTDYRLTREDIEMVIKTYEGVLRDLEVI